MQILSLQYIGSEEEAHGRIRSLICQQLANVEDCADYVAFSEMFENTVWGTDIEITAAANLFRLPIYILSAYRDEAENVSHLTWQVYRPSPHYVSGDICNEFAIYIDNSSGNHYVGVTDF